ncbi:MAG TPA: TIGR02757 family protein [Chitinophagaceae bacterium]|nr:TIGR02757 family protein [Chitinophagaceae bacterium]
MNKRDLKTFLDTKVDQYNQPAFIPEDPVCVPHLFTRQQDIEIAAFFTATFSWGNRRTIIRKSTELMQRMDMQPHAFCLQAEPERLKALQSFRHRTFNDTDLLYFVEFLHQHYRRHDSLEDAFTRHGDRVEDMLAGFYRYFFSLEHVPGRSRKHVATPERKSTCKRLNMFLRWMVRRDNRGVDFGIWRSISPDRLLCPVDVHVARVAKRFNLLQRKQVDWLAAVELTEHLRRFDPKDPVRYDFALFGLGIMEKF